MSAPMRKRPIRSHLLHIVHQGDIYHIPKKIADQYKVERVRADSVLADELFAELDQEYTKPGVLLQGLRHREGLSQVAFAERIGVSQSDLSKMELGKRSIGRVVAKRIAAQFELDYRVFLA